MPNVIDRFPRFEERIKNAKGWYVYAWLNVEWGGIYFYIGKGCKRRALDTKNRGMAFKAILNQWDCFPVLLKDGLTEEEAMVEEDRLKSSYIFEWGAPIMDGEGNSATLKNMAIKRSKEYKRLNDPNYREGRPRTEVPDFPKFLEKTKNGELSVSESCRQLGISRSSWYKYCREGALLKTVKTPSPQNKNKRPNKVIEINGETKTKIEWCEEHGISVQLFNYRTKTKKMTPYEALTTPVRHQPQ